MVIGSFIRTAWPLTHHVLGRVFSETSNHPGDSAPRSTDLVPCDFWLFLKLKSPLKGKRFQTIDEIQENMMGQLMVTGRTAWGPEVPTLKGTEVSLSWVQCFLYLASSSIDVSIFHVTWLGASWTDHAYIERLPCCKLCLGLNVCYILNWILLIFLLLTLTF